MGKFPEADKELNVMICLKCKARNPQRSKKCRKCNYTYLRPKTKELKGKK